VNEEVSEHDLELLEEYLDKALPGEQASALESRLGTDTSLASILEGLRAERQVRAAVFASLEPSDADVTRFAQRVSVAARKQSHWARVARFSGVAGAAAACILVGFFAGWLGRDNGGTSTNVAVGPGVTPQVTRVFNPNFPVEVNAPTPASPGVHISEVRIPDGAGHAAQWLVVARIDPGTRMNGLVVGDVFLSVDGQTVRDVRTLAGLLGQPREHTLKILRDQHELTLRGTVGP
jgi:anti-sigma factor RsiW